LNFGLFKSFSLSLLQRLSLPLFGFGTFYILVRNLNSNELGQWAIFVAITASLEGAKDGLMKNALVHFLNSAKEEEHVKVKSTSLLLNLLVTLGFSVAIFFSAEWFAQLFASPQLALMLKLYTLNLLALVFFSHFNFIQQAKVTYLGILLSFVARQGILFFFVLIGIGIMGEAIPLYQLVNVQLMGIAAGTFISFLYTRKYLQLKFVWEKAWMGKIWRFGRYGMFTNISVSIITSTDHLMLGGMISTSSVAVYNVAVKITNFFNLPSVALSSVLLPKGVQTAAEQNTPKLREIFESAVAATLTGLIPSVLVVLLFPEQIIQFIAGADYLMAKEVLLIIILTTFIMPYFQSYGMIVNALGKPKLDFIFILIISLFNIIANYCLIGWMGLNGAAYASLLTHLVGLLFVLIVLKRMIGVRMLTIGKKVLNMYVRLYGMMLTKIVKRKRHGQ
jgi:lipopolysaccharide exporter